MRIQKNLRYAIRKRAVSQCVCVMSVSFMARLLLTDTHHCSDLWHIVTIVCRFRSGAVSVGSKSSGSHAFHPARRHRQLRAADRGLSRAIQTGSSRRSTGPVSSDQLLHLQRQHVSVPGGSCGQRSACQSVGDDHTARRLCGHRHGISYQRCHLRRSHLDGL